MPEDKTWIIFCVGILLNFASVQRDLSTTTLFIVILLRTIRNGLLRVGIRIILK